MKVYGVISAQHLSLSCRTLSDGADQSDTAATYQNPRKSYRSDLTSRPTKVAEQFALGIVHQYGPEVLAILDTLVEYSTLVTIVARFKLQLPIAALQLWLACLLL